MFETKDEYMWLDKVFGDEEIAHELVDYDSEDTIIREELAEQFTQVNDIRLSEEMDMAQ